MSNNKETSNLVYQTKELNEVNNKESVRTMDSLSSLRENVSQVFELEEEMKQQGYRKLPSEAAGRLLALFQDVPDFIVNNTTLRKANDILKRTTGENIYRIENLQPGEYLIGAKGSDGLYRATRYNESHHLVGQAGLVWPEHDPERPAGTG